MNDNDDKNNNETDDKVDKKGVHANNNENNNKMDNDDTMDKKVCITHGSPGIENLLVKGDKVIFKPLTPS